MAFLKAASALALMMTLASCGGSVSNSSKPVPPAGDTLASACPEVMELMKQGGESIEKAEKEGKLSDPTFLDGLGSVVKRLDEIEVGIKADDEAAPVQNLANAYNKILEDLEKQSTDEPISKDTVKLFVEAVKETSSACINSLQS